MNAPDLLELFVGPLEGIGASYMITGGVASVIYGDPRFTRDIDIVLDLSPGDAQRLTEAFEAGDFYVPPLEVLEAEARRPEGGHFNIIDRQTGLRADVYVQGDDALHAWAFPRRRRLAVGENTIAVAPIEYVILRKLQYYRASGSDRHLRDVAMMLRISGESVDAAELRSWAERLGVAEVLEAARQHPTDG